MFEKEAEEYLYDRLDPKAIDSVSEFSNKHIEEAIVSSFKKGAEFGFQECAKSRLNITTISDCPIKDEWHYIKNRDFPVREDYYVIACHSATGNFTDRCQWLNNEWWDADGETKHFINEQVYAWKERSEPPKEI